MSVLVENRTRQEPVRGQAIVRPVPGHSPDHADELRPFSGIAGNFDPLHLTGPDHGYPPKTRDPGQWDRPLENERTVRAAAIAGRRMASLFGRVNDRHVDAPIIRAVVINSGRQSGFETGPGEEAPYPEIQFVLKGQGPQFCCFKVNDAPIWYTRKRTPGRATHIIPN
jgi:hypothetical protein